MANKLTAANWLVLFAVGSVIASCGQRPNAPSEQLQLWSTAEAHDGVLKWDPNDAKSLWITAEGLSENKLETVVWRQSGLPIDDSGWQGRDLLLVAGPTGCGFGGVTFVISAGIPGSNNSASISIEMERYICQGSP